MSDRTQGRTKRLAMVGATLAAALALAACSGAATTAPSVASSASSSTEASASPSMSAAPSTSSGGGGGYDYGSGSASASAASGGSGTGGGSAVKVVDFGFDPGSITVKVGTSVTWTNTGAATHTVTADDSSFDSGNLAGGATFSQTFAKAGTFTYHCNIHRSMKGTVVVTP